MATVEELQEEARILAEAKKGVRKEKFKSIVGKIKTGAQRTSQALSTAASLPGKPINAPILQRAPQTILSKEQAMLGMLFNQKNQMWGGNNPVNINRTLTSGYGLIKTGSGDDTRRLLF